MTFAVLEHLRVEDSEGKSAPDFSYEWDLWSMRSIRHLLLAPCGSPTQRYALA
jgi:hypothetical protein